MKTFTIENGTNNITLHPTIQEVEAAANAECFDSEGGLAKLAATWPGARLVDIWNSLPGVAPVKKFKDRATAVNRLWKAIQSLDGMVEADTTQAAHIVPAPAEIPVTVEIALVESEAEALVAEQAITDNSEAYVAPPVAPQKPDLAPTEAPAKAKATRTKKAPKAPTNASVPRAESKTSQVIAMLKRKGGVTLKELMAEMGWQSHTTRALMSAGGSLAKKHGLTVVSTKGENGDRIYSINV